VGLVCSDRWSAYHLIPVRRRQLRWAHLRRDFQAMIDRGGAAKAIGEELLHADLLFGLRYKVRDSTRRRRWLLGHVNDWLRAEVRSLLEECAACCAKTAGVCAEILKLEPALWTFARQEGLEPSNNAAERAVGRERPGMETAQVHVALPAGEGQPLPVGSAQHGGARASQVSSEN
jgi:transposase